MLHLLLSVSASVAAAALSAPSDAPNARPPALVEAVTRSRGAPAVDTFTFLDNGVIRLGIDTSRGGTLGWLGPSSDRSLSLLNVHDFGRVVQGSFYSGPAVFDPNGKCSEPGGWGRPWPWNPIGAGDVYLHAAPIINLTVAPGGTSASVWTQPYQWACDTVPCDCLFEQTIALVGNAVEVELTMHTARADKTFYAGQTQELPAVYVIGDYCHLWTYNGSAPFTGDAATEQPAVWGENAWDAFTSGERWMAFANASGYGVGVVSPFVAHFGAGFFDNGKIGTYNCVPKGLGPYDSPTGYIAPWGAEIIDPSVPYAYRFALVLGSVAEVRAYAAAQHAAGADEPLAPAYRFAARGDRAHAVYNDAVDAGLPVGARGLLMNFTGPHPQVIGPFTAFAPRDAPRVVVRATYAADAALAGAVAGLAWTTPGAGTPCGTCYAAAPVVADGAAHDYVFDLAAIPSYTAAPTIERIVFAPVGFAGAAPALLGRQLVAVESIAAQ